MTETQFSRKIRRYGSRDLVFLLLAINLLTLGCGRNQPEPTTAPRAQPVSVATVTSKSVERYYDTLGVATAFEAVNIVSQVNGQIVSSPFTQGSFVRKGDLLFEIYKPPYEAALQEAQGRLSQAQAQWEINQLNLERSRPLVPEKLISEQDFQALQATVKENLAAIETSRGEVIAAEVNLDYTDIRAPIEGMVGLYEVNLGNVVTSLDGQVLTTIQRMDPLYIDFILPVSKFAELRQYFNKAKGSLTLQASDLTDPSRNRKAQMSILGNAITNETGTVNLRAIMENSDALFWPNQPLSVRIFLETIPEAILVPADAVSTGQNGAFVFVVGKNNKVTQTSVTLGQLQDDNTLVIEQGLQVNQQVVTDGQLMLRTGTLVTIKEQDGQTTSTHASSPTTPSKPNPKADASSRS